MNAHHTEPENFQIVLKNKRIWSYYNENKHIDFETANLLLINFLESIFNEAGADKTASVNSQLLSYFRESTNQLEFLKTNIEKMDEKLVKMNTEISSGMVTHLSQLKKEYIDQVKEIISNNTLSANEKVSAIVDKNTEQLIDKTRLVLNDLLPKTNESNNKSIQQSLEQLHKQIYEDIVKLARTVNNERMMTEFVSNFETKYNSMLQTAQQPIYSFVTASETRLNQNIDSIKETALGSSKVLGNLEEFLGKYNVSSNKGKFGEHNLQNILNTMFPTAEVKDTSGQKSSGDVLLIRNERSTILFENKDYKFNIDKDEISKFIKDVETQNVNGIFLSQNSGIAFKQNYQIDIHRGNVLVYIQNCEYSPDRIRIAIDIIDALSLKLQDFTDEDDSNIISTEILDDINNEYRTFITQKDNMIMMLRDFQKKMATQIEDLQMPSLDKYLAPKYAFVKARTFDCDLCNHYTANTKQSLAAHKRGCRRKHGDEKPSSDNLFVKTK
jgi:hypothetical protein